MMAMDTYPAPASLPSRCNWINFVFVGTFVQFCVWVDITPKGQHV